MEILLPVFLCLLAGSEVTSGAGEEPTVIRVEKGKDATLPCSISTKEDITKKTFEWKKGGRQVFKYNAGIHSNNGEEGQHQQFIRRVDYFKVELKSGDASITIRNIKEADSGDYACEFPDLQPSQIFYIQLVVVGPPEDEIIKKALEDGTIKAKDIPEALRDEIIKKAIKDGKVKSSANALVGGSTLKLFFLMVSLVFLF